MVKPYDLIIEWVGDRQDSHWKNVSSHYVKDGCLHVEFPKDYPVLGPYVVPNHAFILARPQERY
ncbi:hypothetical protein SEA_PINKIEPIE_243 [Streptomyces phage PinkiePie]|nr:hypothetical protein SEA_SQUILLIUM_245 [Streptomyces phage Squillium]WNM73463.1 hypothetical protein SEA_LIANDRY_242 [Streptomyces phage Liandry]WNM74865.1 hypothetical protein SEA_PINKIEPIE_243 [Streptomyces phage PinkiePie]